MNFDRKICLRYFATPTFNLTRENINKILNFADIFQFSKIFPVFKLKRLVTISLPKSSGKFLERFVHQALDNNDLKIQLFFCRLPTRAAAPYMTVVNLFNRTRLFRFWSSNRAHMICNIYAKYFVLLSLKVREEFYNDSKSTFSISITKLFSIMLSKYSEIVFTTESMTTCMQVCSAFGFV